MAMLMMRSDAPTFLMHRVVRIYPIYYIVVALVFLASLASPIKPPFDWRALSLFPYGGKTYPLGVEWTLVFEIAFYVFVALLIWFRKTGSAVSFLVGWLALILLNNILRPDNPQVNVYHPFLLPFVTVNVGFAMGMLIPLVWRDRSVHPVLAAVLAVTLFYVGSSLGVMQVRWCMGVGAALLVHSLTHHVPTWTHPVVDAVGDRLGGYSYAIYLCHVPVVRTLYAVWTDATPMTLFWSAAPSSVPLASPWCCSAEMCPNCKRACLSSMHWPSHCQRPSRLALWWPPMWPPGTIGMAWHWSSRPSAKT